jgi:ATP-dependent exoDNAse (exonuclease V) beta subunit
MLDYLIGTEALNTNISGIETVRSPLRAFYTSSAVQESQPEVFYETISNLIVLRAKLHKHQATKETVLRLVDLISFVNMYEAADERMTNSSPYNQQVNAVQLMTVFKAKGLEFEHVFLLSLQDEVWGNSTRGKSNKLTLPANLAPIRHAGASEDERLRILFVAITRAKFGLYLTTNTENYDGRSTKRLKYLDEQEQPDGSHKALVLPEHTQTVEKHTGHAPALQTLELDWHEHHLKGIAVSQLKGLLKERLESYRLSPTHLNTFIDMEYGGPEKFFFNTLLRFPQAPNINGQFGSAIHDTLEWVQHQVNEQGSVPAIHSVTKFFSTCMKAHKLTPEQTTLEIERGTQALTAYILKKQTMFKPGDKPEYSFKNEGVFVGDAHLNGKIDRMEIDKTNKTIVVVDYKTSKNFNKWGSSAKLHKYKQQLYCYKLLVEGSHTFRGYEVIKGRLEFIEPDPDGAINTLELDFEKDELEKTKQLLQIMWQHVMQLKFPSIATYKPTYVGIRKFEQDLLDGNV